MEFWESEKMLRRNGECVCRGGVEGVLRIMDVEKGNWG